jgi:putative phosphotransacetylase
LHNHPVASSLVREMTPQVDRPVVENIVREVVLARLGSCRDAADHPSRLVVHASARHMHVSKQDLETLFGPGHQLKPLRPLYQPGTFAAEETVVLVGPRGRVISNLRILGPVRSASQVELSFSDAIMLGIENVPLRLSGDIAGTPGVFVMGPQGAVELKQGVIRAAMHVHMSPADAEFYGVRHRDVMRLRVNDGTGVTFDHVLVRVDPAFRLEVHMDTDEANACALHLAKSVELLKS